MKPRRLPPVTATLSQGPYRQRTSTLGQTLCQAQIQQRAALLDVATCVRKTDGTQLSPQYLSDIEHSRRQSSLHVLTEPARTLGLDEDFFLVRAKPAESVVREYLLAHHAQGKAVIAFFRIANALYFEAWDTSDNCCSAARSKQYPLQSGGMAVPDALIQGRARTVRSLEKKTDRAEVLIKRRYECPTILHTPMIHLLLSASEHRGKNEGRCCVTAPIGGF